MSVGRIGSYIAIGWRTLKDRTSFFGLAAQASKNHIIALFTTRDPTAYSNQQRGSVMNPKSKVTLPAAVALGLLAASFPASADDVPDGLSVEWQGKKPCEKLYEDTQVLVARCTFPPGAVHLCHTHPSYVYYVLSGGKAEVQDEKGKRKVDVATGAVVDSPPVPWHELANVGETTLQFLIVEKKYQTTPHVSQTECPKRTSQ